MNYPSSTYRIQFNPEFSFDDFEKRIPYFQKLGVGTIYASPILESTPGSTHGYDGVDPAAIDPELGSLEQLRKISEKLKEAGITWLQDIVPNHMAFHSENPWLMDVLEKGQQSQYASFFDIAWNNRMFHGKIMVPFLTRDLSEVIESNGLQLDYADDRLIMQYESAVFPLNLRSYVSILSYSPENQPQSVQQLLSQLKEINEVEEPRAFSERFNELKLQLASLVKTEQVGAHLKQALGYFNNDPAKLREIVDQQTYALCHWQTTEEKINFRRFFTVNGLICLNMQYDEVFDAYHQLVRQLVTEGVVQGLRIDHIDGLFDPASYLQKLRAAVGHDTYIIAEKILEKEEELPAGWPIEGTTGYEFLAMVNNLFTNAGSLNAFDTFYQSITQLDKSVHDQLLSKKSEILYGHMGGELENLYQLFVELQLASGEELEQSGKEDLKVFVGELLIHCPVYRYYGNQMPLPETDQKALKGLIEEVLKFHPNLKMPARLFEECMIVRPNQADEEYRSRALEFYQRCMQFSGPLMAKGGEDTLMYTNHRFIGHNEVGDFPDRFGVPVKEFHAYMRNRQQHWPMALNATSTHDTKRGEDVRARLNVLTDLGEVWIGKVREWREMNAGLKKGGPDLNDEYLIYQTIVGAYPMPGEDEEDFLARLKEYLQKALREGKVNSTWSEPNEAYEQEVKDFVTQILKQESPFYQNFKAFLNEIADYGIINSLAQLMLKFTCPGVPDVYQGCELWDLSLVDPDNRRPVDYAKRADWLQDLEDKKPEEIARSLWENRYSAQIKLWLTNHLFKLRADKSLLFTKGEYIPLKTRGEYKQHLMAFARKSKKDFYVVVIPLHIATLCREQETSFFDLDWKDTSVVLPDSLSPDWEDILGGRELELQGKLLPKEVFGAMPVAILKGTKLDNERKAGVLLHISSLPSPYGIGDLGPEAFAFADFLNRSDQKVWQILPLNPTEASQANSPYSALSSRAGNPLLISPDMLVTEGLLDGEWLAKYQQEPSAKTDFNKADLIKTELLKKAFEAYTNKSDDEEKKSFDVFCRNNTEWLPDFALYVALKRKHSGAPWYEWPEQFRSRDQDAVAEVEKDDKGLIDFVKWQQYIFDKQWKNLRTYCNQLDINMLGDIPFYVSYDSADVWANRQFFCVDESGKISGIAGVPPDAFSEDGQLWGMPVFNWPELEKQGYQWWIDRLAKNIELFDLVRLDHFRAFADYWEVPGGEKTAVNGTWKTGPDADFFQKIEAALGKLPFIAEDLGEISPEVYKLRDKFSLPGMKVLQFAFDENMPQSDHIPHNYSANFIAYTGTHDNNTVKGWFEQTAQEGVKQRLEAYIGKEVTAENAYREMARLVYASVAKVAMLPMQDVLNLDESAKMNLPGSNAENWAWRLLPGQISDEHGQFLAELTVLFNRD
ncbi:malto-oligosyltrehalose synthase [Dyadobacter aurulentus]|uniref:malto-oligosyltrehalose synthase n=1 Tax=Dyadobacter sp. UC 10 TaxID=2605428 RepID=UPI0011F2B9D2|nr:malto-oligosyltrehalose synthase [Dyadobacter sp. UC 10]KAA0993795.1 malto-oligosyltrehalose synthase [Dyadobacter sp. UC 10]